MRENLYARKFFKLYNLKKAVQKSCFGQQFARKCAKISTEYGSFMEGARKLIRAKFSYFRADEVRENFFARKLVRIR